MIKVHVNATTAAILIWKATVELHFSGNAQPEANLAVVLFRDENSDNIWKEICIQAMINVERTALGGRFVTDFGRLPNKRIIDIQITDDLIEARYLGDA